METDRKVDLKAVAKIAQRVDLRDIRLTEIAATSKSHGRGLLEPKVSHDCEVRLLDSNDQFEVNCRYHFTVRTDEEEEIASATFVFTILYELAGDEEIRDGDLDEFAFANGTYHSWPFVRQLLFDLTSKMGYPPYVLPVLKFNPKNSIKAPQPTEEIKTEEPS